MTDTTKVYIGDGCFVRFDGRAIWLTTEDGITVENEVCLEPEVFVELVKYAATVFGAESSKP